MTDKENDKRNTEVKTSAMSDMPGNGRAKRILPGQKRSQFGGMNANGKRRLQPQSPVKQAGKSALKKALPYLIAGGSTGLGLGIGLSDLIL